MLDRAQLAKKLQNVADSLFIDVSAELSSAREAWEKLVADPLAQYKAHACSSVFLVPSWNEPLGQTYGIEIPEPYAVVGVDGSQIYPDRHQGIGCYLINVGTFYIDYAIPHVVTANQPFVYSGNDSEFEISTDLVNAQRQEHELIASIEYIRSLSTESKPLVMMDGSLIFWHIASKDVTMKNAFLEKYMRTLEALYKDSILYVGYISLPRSKELVNLLRLHLCNYDVVKAQDYTGFDHLVDASIVKFFVKERMRTIVFKNNSPVTHSYPDHAHPHFFYLNTGVEIARVEIPAWIAWDENKVNAVASIMLDQSIKGGGYPVVLAEAHEQAVVKGPDREFFYHLIQRLGYEYQKTIITSQKSFKKRSIGI